MANTWPGEMNLNTPLPGHGSARRDLRKELTGPSPRFRGGGRLGVVIRRLWWIRHYTADFLIMLTGHIPFHSVRMLLYRQVFGMTIGAGTSIHSRCRFYNARLIRIGCHSVINNDVLLDGRTDLLIGNNVSISEGVAIITLEHDLDSPDFSALGGPVTVDDFVFIGARATILPGVTLGKGSVVGAGAVATRCVDPYAIVAGNPAHFVRYRSTNLNYELRYRKLLG